MANSVDLPQHLTNCRHLVIGISQCLDAYSAIEPKFFSLRNAVELREQLQKALCEARYVENILRGEKDPNAENR